LIPPFVLKTHKQKQTKQCGAGVHTASTCWWDAETDGKLCVTYDRNQTMYVIVAVFWVAI